MYFENTPEKSGLIILWLNGSNYPDYIKHKYFAYNKIRDTSISYFIVL